MAFILHNISLFIEIYHIVSQKQIRDANSSSGPQPNEYTQTIQVAPTESDTKKQVKCCQ